MSDVVKVFAGVVIAGIVGYIIWKLFVEPKFTIPPVPPPMRPPHLLMHSAEGYVQSENKYGLIR